MYILLQDLSYHICVPKDAVLLDVTLCWVSISDILKGFSTFILKVKQSSLGFRQ
jgi:hypothetical protein